MLLAGCGEKNTYVAPPPPKVTVAPPAKHPVTRYLEATGNTAAVNSADLVARVTGFVEAIKYNDGDFVKKGTLAVRHRAEALCAQGRAGQGDGRKRAGHA